MKSLSILGVILILLCGFLSGCVLNNSDDEGTTSLGFIQQAINEARDGDIIQIPSGTYHETLTVNKSLTLRGTNRDTTILIGENSESVVHIAADNCTVQEVTILANDSIESIAGISIASNNNTIMNTTILNATWGVYLSPMAHNNTVSFNTLANNTHGIFLLNASTNNITKNTISSNSMDGIQIRSASNNNVVYENTITSNQDHGVHITGSNHNLIVRNSIVENYNGVRICCASYHNKVYHNDFIQNTNWDAYDSDENQWDNGTVGNYWDTYIGDDTDGNSIGDSPYLIVGGSHDRYPVMTSFGLPT